MYYPHYDGDSRDRPLYAFPVASGYRVLRRGRSRHPGARLLRRAVGRSRPHRFGRDLQYLGWRGPPHWTAIHVTLGRICSVMRRPRHPRTRLLRCAAIPIVLMGP